MLLSFGVIHIIFNFPGGILPVAFCFCGILPRDILSVRFYPGFEVSVLQ